MKSPDFISQGAYKEELYEFGDILKIGKWFSFLSC
jgi:hypothetical protein